jgi:hypothetical protein
MLHPLPLPRCEVLAVVVEGGSSGDSLQWMRRQRLPPMVGLSLPVSPSLSISLTHPSLLFADLQPAGPDLARQGQIQRGGQSTAPWSSKEEVWPDSVDAMAVGLIRPYRGLDWAR